MNQALNQRDMFFKWLYYAGATLLLVLVQSLVLNRICVWGVHPFLPPLIAAITAMLEGPGEGAAFAGVFGLLCDLTMPDHPLLLYTGLSGSGAAGGCDRQAVSEPGLSVRRSVRRSVPAGDRSSAHAAADIPPRGGAYGRPVSDGAGGRRDCGAVAAGVSAAAQRTQPYPEIGGVL